MIWRLPSATYEVFLSAMRERKRIVCRYAGRRLEVCPVALGFTRNAEKALVYRVEEDNDGSSAEPDWLCLSLAGVSVLRLREAAWIVGERSGAPPACIADVEYDLSPEEPDRPRFEL